MDLGTQSAYPSPVQLSAKKRTYEMTEDSLSHHDQTQLRADPPGQRSSYPGSTGTQEPPVGVSQVPLDDASSTQMSFTLSRYHAERLNAYVK